MGSAIKPQRNMLQETKKMEDAEGKPSIIFDLQDENQTAVKDCSKIKGQRKQNESQCQRGKQYNGLL